MKKLVLYDAADDSLVSKTWGPGARLFADEVAPVRNFSGFLKVLSWVNAPVEVQFWGHGFRGGFKVGPNYVTRSDLLQLRRTVVPRGCQIWFRTCSTMSGEAGLLFAQAVHGIGFDAVYGHTRDIGFWQSGLVGYPGMWDLKESGASGPFKPSTVSCFHMNLPRFV